MAKKLKLRIVSDGTALGTRVLDGNGNEVCGVQAITWEVDSKKQTAMAQVSLVNVPVYLKGEVEVKASEVQT